MANEMKLYESWDRFNRLNQNSGIYQSRATAQKMLESAQRLGAGNEYKGIVLFVQSSILLPIQSFSPTNAGPTPDLDGITREYVRVYYRLPTLHRDIPLPPAFRKDAILNHFRETEFQGRKEGGPPSDSTRSQFEGPRITPSYLNQNNKLKEPYANGLWISSHPYVTYPADLTTETLGPGDIIQVTFPAGQEILNPQTPFKLLKKAPAGINWKSSLDKNIKNLSNAFDETAIAQNLRDVDSMRFNPDPPVNPEDENVKSPCYGTDDGTLTKEAEACGFKDPRILLAIRLKEVGQNADDRKIRFEAHIFLNPRANSQLKLTRSNIEPSDWGYTKKYIKENPYYIPSDAEYDPDSDKTYLDQVLPKLYNPDGEVNQNGGIYYIPNPEFIKGETKNNADKVYKWGNQYRKYQNAHFQDAAFLKAYEYDPARAIKCTSFGRYQVMGWALLKLASGSPEKALQMYLSDPVTVAAKMFAIWCKSEPARTKAIEKLNLAADRVDTNPTLEEWLAWSKVYNGANCCPFPSDHTDPVTGLLVPAAGYHVEIRKKYKASKKICPKIAEHQPHQSSDTFSGFNESVLF
tara:strand:+ start:98 stop:1828 length:1731 start_codon:yes stop_codon:yes gene_type:complete